MNFPEELAGIDWSAPTVLFGVNHIQFRYRTGTLKIRAELSAGTITVLLDYSSPEQNLRNCGVQYEAGDPYARQTVEGALRSLNRRISQYEIEQTPQTMHFSSQTLERLAQSFPDSPTQQNSILGLSKINRTQVRFTSIHEGGILRSVARDVVFCIPFARAQASAAWLSIVNPLNAWPAPTEETDFQEIIPQAFFAHGDVFRIRTSRATRDNDILEIDYQWMHRRYRRSISLLLVRRTFFEAFRLMTLGVIAENQEWIDTNQPPNLTVDIGQADTQEYIFLDEPPAPGQEITLESVARAREILTRPPEPLQGITTPPTFTTAEYPTAEEPLPENPVDMTTEQVEKLIEDSKPQPKQETWEDYFND